MTTDLQIDDRLTDDRLTDDRLTDDRLTDDQKRARTEELLTRLADRSTLMLGQSAQNILDNSTGSIDKIFDYALNRIKQVREACDAAEAAITFKRNSVRDVLTEYVAVLQTIENTAKQSQQALGDAMIVTDRFPA